MPILAHLEGVRRAVSRFGRFGPPCTAGGDGAIPIGLAWRPFEYRGAVSMTRPSDKDRVLQILGDTTGLSNLRIKTELGLGDDRYTAIKDELLENKLVEKTQGRGGGLRLTKKGERESPDFDGFKSSPE